MTDTPDLFVELIHAPGWKLFLDMIAQEMGEIRRGCLENDQLSEKEHFANVRVLRTIRKLIMNSYLAAGYTSDALPGQFAKLFA